MIEFIAGFALFLLLLSVLAAAADGIDRRDARRRNHVSRRR